MSLSARLPWWSKIAAKLVLARLPVGYGVWKRLGLFQHGRMESPDYALGVARKHLGRVDFGRRSEGFVALELGPGDSVAAGVVMRSLGAAATHLVDAGRFAREDLQTYRELFRILDLDPALVEPEPTSFSSLLDRFSIDYQTDGLKSLRTIPDASVDLIWSNAVYEHIRLAEVEATTTELRRILRPDGVCSHTIDLKDHLGGGANHLRVPERVWESETFASSGFYTNRLRRLELVSIFERCGFRVEIHTERRWQKMPVRQSRLEWRFRDLPADELMISDLEVVLHPA
ncbi:MAG: class I SAM-dependent methyltransferase [Gemmatimonadetes bacterium]|nr:class I SAM-dependent methyltransferase [Gemmatimonadota bacterium]